MSATQNWCRCGVAEFDAMVVGIAADSDGVELGDTVAGEPAGDTL